MSLSSARLVHVAAYHIYRWKLGRRVQVEPHKRSVDFKPPGYAGGTNRKVSHYERRYQNIHGRKPVGARFRLLAITPSVCNNCTVREDVYNIPKCAARRSRQVARDSPSATVVHSSPARTRVSYSCLISLSFSALGRALFAALYRVA